MTPYKRCPQCGSPHIEVTDTRGTGPDRVRVRRKRKCHECGYNWRTIELDEIELTRLEACARVMRSIYTLMLKEGKHEQS